MERKIIVNEAVNSLMAEMVLDEAIRQYKQRQLYREIDAALSNKDKAAFLTLTSELKSLMSTA
ncbi:IDEAL domain-containing protein [Paenibacillus turpanensis]|uniref:IDEAL domain-containing protein n=1 Tax=Paenibacillus turpanensis TaxID=2689078 RepID=UPI00140942E1|nr:IDEAL domain-containing protein [Paenibacillus turpanensis]